MGYRNRASVAWYGDMTLGGHLWAFTRLGRARVMVEFHPPRHDLATSRSRKELTQRCYATISGGVAKALGGKGR